MSHVTDIIIAFSVSDKDRAHDIEGFFAEKGDNPPKLINHDGHGGNAALQRSVMIGAHNHFNRLPELISFLKGLTWYFPEDVQLLVCFEHADPHTFQEQLGHAKLKLR